MLELGTWFIVRVKASIMQNILWATYCRKLQLNGMCWMTWSGITQYFELNKNNNESRLFFLFKFFLIFILSQSVEGEKIYDAWHEMAVLHWRNGKNCPALQCLDMINLLMELVPVLAGWLAPTGSTHKNTLNTARWLIKNVRNIINLFYNIIKMEELTRHIFVYKVMYSTFTMETYFAVSLTPQFRKFVM